MVMGGCCEEDRKHWWSWVGIVRRKGSTGGHGWVLWGGKGALVVMGGCCEEEREHWWSWVGVVRRKGSTGGYV